MTFRILVIVFYLLVKDINLLFILLILAILCLVEGTTLIDSSFMAEHLGLTILHIS